MEKTYDFRIRLILAPGEQLNIDSPELDVSDYYPGLVLTTGDPNTSIRNSKNLVVRGSEYPTEEAALASGVQARDLLSRAFSRLHIGADFGDRAPKSGFLQGGLAMLEQGGNRKVVNDIHGLMTFENSPDLAFARLGDARLTRGWNEEKVLKVFRLSSEHPEAMTEKERLSYDLFSASYFERSQDARLVTLAMSYEVLLEPQERPKSVLQHVESLIEQTRNASNLSTNQINSLLGSLQWLLSESISQAGRRLARERLGEREYNGMTAERFFTHCYRLRSKLVHGEEPFPTRSEVSLAAASFETFVGDILSGPLLNIPI